MIRRSFLFPLTALVALGVLTACGGGSNPASSSQEDGGVVVRGALAGSASALSGASSASVVTVIVKEQPSIKATVGADGSFTLRGLPQGSFALVFSDERGVIGELEFDGVAANQEITIMVRINSSGVTLMDQRRNGIGHGNVEIEGRVRVVLVLSRAGDSKFLIDGYTVVARPGETAIRGGDVSDLTVGRQVHVKGSWLPSFTASTATVLAHEIKLQGGNSGGGS